MRREGRQHGWVFAVDRSLIDHPTEGGSKSRRRRAVLVEGAAAAAANGGGFVRAPRKPTNHSKPGVGRAYKHMIGGGGGGSKGTHDKFKHDAVKTYYLELEGAYYDAAVDAYDTDA